MSDVSNRSGRSPKMSKCANPSGCLPKMSDHERFAQVAHQKWAKEQISCFFEQIAHSLIFLQKMSHSLRKPMSKFPTLIFRRFRNTSTENYKCILHSLASSLSLINIYIFRRFMNTSTENYKCILHSLASLFLSPTHLYLQEVYEYENGELYRQTAFYCILRLSITYLYLQEVYEY